MKLQTNTMWKPCLALAAAVVLGGCAAEPGEDGVAPTVTAAPELNSAVEGIDLRRVSFSVHETYRDRYEVCLSFAGGAVDHHKLLFVGALGDLRAVTVISTVEGPHGYSQICTGSSPARRGERVTIDFVRTDASVVRATFSANWVRWSGQRYLNWSDAVTNLDLHVEKLPVGSPYEGMSLLPTKCTQDPFACSEERKHAP